MSEWRECTIGDAPFEIIDGDRGKNYPTQNELFDNGHCVFLSTKNVTSSGLSFSELNFITKEKDGVLRKGKLKRGDLVLTTRGTVGNVAYYNDSVVYDHIRINSGMVIIRPEGIDQKFNYQLFKYLKDQFDVFASGSAQPQLPIKDMKQIEVKLPQLQEQKAIASVLSSLDDKIDLLHRQNKTLEAMAEALFRQWFVEEAQDDWEEVSIGELFSISSGKAASKITGSGDYPVFGANGIIGYTHSFLYEEKILLTGRVGTLGNIFRVENDKIWPSDNTLVILPEKYYNFVYFSLKKAKIEEYNVGSTQPLIRQSDVKEIKISLPYEGKLNRFEIKTEAIFQKINCSNLQIRTLEKLRDNLLPKLMSGEVRVNYA